MGAELIVPWRCLYGDLAPGPAIPRPLIHERLAELVISVTLTGNPGMTIFYHLEHG